VPRRPAPSASRRVGTTRRINCEIHDNLPITLTTRWRIIASAPMASAGVQAARAGSEVKPMSEIGVPVSFGELLDKISILEIKAERMSDPAKLGNVRRELAALQATWSAHPASRQDMSALRAALKSVNERLWVIEDDIRAKEMAQAFDAEFVRLARAVYFENDERAHIKKQLNLALGSTYIEEKSYQDYGTGSSRP
jgi:hypothetical protein